MTSDYKLPEQDSENYDLWGRVGCIEIDLGKNSSYNGGKPLHFTNLDFSFKVTKILGNYPEGDVELRILGLKQDTINQIVTICNVQEALQQEKRIRIFAGYKDMGEGKEDYYGDKIIEADISYAKVDSPPPNMWVSIVGVIGFRYKFQQTNVSFPGDEELKRKVKKIGTRESYRSGPGGVPISVGSEEYEYEAEESIKYKDLCKKCVDFMNVLYKAEGGPRVELDYRSSKNEPVTQFTSGGTIADLIQNLQQERDVYVFLDNDKETDNLEKLIVIDRPKEAGNTRFDNQINQSRAWVRIKHLSKKTGMIGIPSVADGVSLHCRMLLDPRLTVGDYIDLNSQLMPAANGDKWMIMKVTHTGHLRGNEWYTDVEAVDFDRQCANEKAQKEKQHKVDEVVRMLKAT